jgi:hypothetical protein
MYKHACMPIYILAHASCRARWVAPVRVTRDFQTRLPCVQVPVFGSVVPSPQRSGKRRPCWKTDTPLICWKRTGGDERPKSKRRVHAVAPRAHQPLPLLFMDTTRSCLRWREASMLCLLILWIWVWVPVKFYTMSTGTGRVLYPTTIWIWVWYCSTLPIPFSLPSLY